MSEFSLSSNYFTNIASVASKSSVYNEIKFSIVINDVFTIEIPQIVAASVSRVISQMVESDQIASELRISIKSNKDIRSSLEKIRNCISTRGKVTLDDDDILVFGEFGFLIENEDFSRPMGEKLELESKALNVENVISILNMKQKFSVSDISNEVSFIASNFESMKTNEGFISFCSDQNNLSTVEEILESNELKLEDEDTLVSFLINICNINDKNDAFLVLFDKVLFQYCSVECCEAFLKFVEEVVESPGVRSLISCIGRRCVQPVLPVNPSFVKGRHIEHYIEPHIEVTDDDPMNGILKREHKKGNLTLNASSINGSGLGVYNLVDENENNLYQSQNYENSNITASFKDKKTFVIKSYMMKDYGSGHSPKNWILEGQLSSDGSWITVDEQNNNPLTTNDIHKFNVTCNERLKAVRITQKGYNCYGNGNQWYFFTLKAFDIYGSLYE